LGGPFHGTAGPVPVSRVAEADLSPVDRAYVAAAQALGFPWCADLNGEAVQHPGVGPTPKNVADGVRMHGAFTYLAPARQRPNLTLIPDALVDRVRVEDGRTTGVRTADGREVRGRLVVLCAGAYGSPAILLRSGIGPAAELRALDIPVVADRPGVGAHLLDHTELIFADGDDVAPYVVRPNYEPAALSAIPLLLKARSRQVAAEIDLYLFSGCRRDEARGRWVAFFGVDQEVARSQGRVGLTAPDPAATLAIDHGYFADLADLEALCDGAELIARLLATPPLAAALEPVPGQTLGWRDRDDLRARVRDRVESSYHPAGTCRMGSAGDSGAVVDHGGQVYGIGGLRVADAAVFPTIPRANVHCTVVAVAEKLADAIRRDLPT
jgi:choline dehydrogenase